jgi:hypothetical protein
MKSFNFEYDNWHLWDATKGYLLSDESLKRLYSFNTIDQAINWLFLNGHKDAARALNNKLIKDGIK